VLADTEAFIERFRYKATKAVQVQSRIKQLARVERIEVDAEDTAMLHLRFPPAPRSGSYPVIAEHLTKRYGDHLVFSDATFTIHRGDKVAFVGKNGEGKSTLVKCIMGEIADYSGTLRLGHNVRIGYFAQNQAQLLDETKTVFETIDYVATGDIRTKIRDILGAFMFGGEASDKKVGVLSGGERSRLAMIRLLLEPVNLLILEPERTVLAYSDQIGHIELRLRCLRFRQVHIHCLEIHHIEGTHNKEHKQEEHDVNHGDNHDLRLFKGPSVAESHASSPSAAFSLCKEVSMMPFTPAARASSIRLFSAAEKHISISVTMFSMR